MTMPPWYYGDEWYDDEQAYLSTIGKKKQSKPSSPKVAVGPANPAYDPVLAAAADKEDEEAAAAEIHEHANDYGQVGVVGKFWKNMAARNKKTRKER